VTQYETRSETQTQIESEYRPGYISQCSDLIISERSGDRIPVGAKFSTPIQTGLGAHPSSCTKCTGSLLELTIFVGLHVIPAPFFLAPVPKHIQTCQFLTQCFAKYFYLNRNNACSLYALYQVSGVIP